MNISPSQTNKIERHIYTVSEITASIKSILEERFPFVWISGEISNFRIPSSGHSYFTLKDENAQISSVIFRGQRRNLNFDLEDGLKVIGLGRISVYEPRGTYQIIFEYIEPKGVGALQVALEQLKKRLLEEGLFDDKHKKAMPLLPKKISLITSPTGAVVHDIMNVVYRRYPNTHLEIVPVKVQGDGAVNEIVNAFKLLNDRLDTSVIILARGGGSLEDLQAFNSEAVARSIFDSEIPVISAVGHEIDYTIADFAADLRAPTPSVAAELVVPLKNDLVVKQIELLSTLKTIFIKYLDYRRFLLSETSKRLIDPQKKIQDLRLKLDDFIDRLIGTALRGIRQHHDMLNWRTQTLLAGSPLSMIHKLKEKLNQIDYNSFTLLNININLNWSKIREWSARLNALNPAAILDRGYSITRTIPEAIVVRDPDDVFIHQNLEVMVAKGALICRVERKSTDGNEDI